MLADSLPALSGAARSALLWWEMAGVDLVVEDDPHRWLDAARATALLEDDAAPARAVPHAAPAPARPHTLDALLAHLLNAPELTEAGPPAQRIAASGDPAAPLMILTDTPDEGDAGRGALLSGASSRLFDAMLRAIGRTRADCYLAALCPGIPAGGLLPSAAVPQYAGFARDHVRFAGAQTVWLLGSAAIRAILEADALPLPQGLQLFNHPGGKKAVVAGLAPRFLLRQPRMKAQAWAAMQNLLTGNMA